MDYFLNTMHLMPDYEHRAIFTPMHLHCSLLMMKAHFRRQEARFKVERREFIVFTLKNECMWYRL